MCLVYMIDIYIYTYTCSKGVYVMYDASTNEEIHVYIYIYCLCLYSTMWDSQDSLQLVQITKVSRLGLCQLQQE